MSAQGYVTESEPNDDFAHADTVHCGDTVWCATLEPATETDFYRFYLNNEDSLIATTFDCNGSITNTFMVLFNDEDSVLAVNDDGGPRSFSRIRYRATQPGDYFLRVLKHPWTPDSSYCLDVGCPGYLPEAYDLCQTPRIIPSLPYYDEGSTLGATHQCGTAAPDVFYGFYFPVVGNLFVTVCTNSFNARVQVIGRCCGDFWDDADTGCGLGAELISFGLAEGNYLLLVEGTQANQAGNFSIEVEAALPGCLPPDSIVLTTVGSYPLLDWPEMVGPSYYVVWQSPVMQGPFEHLGIAFQTYFVDSTGFTSTRKFYMVTSVCPW